jgi:hypothetical protein
MTTSVLTEEQRKKPVVYGQLEKIIDGLADENIKLVQRQVAALEQRIAAIEARPQLRYCGVFDHEKSYAVGSLTTHKGGLWHCNASVGPGITPGTSKHWQLTGKTHR